MNIFTKYWEQIDNALRHESVLGRHDWLRNLLRRPYHRMLNLNPSGYGLRLGGCLDVRVPAEFRSKLMESYEIEEFREIKKWCDCVSGGWFIDVGSSVGYMSCAALSANRHVRVVAIDTDLNSLKSVKRVCRYSGLERLVCIQTMIVGTGGNEHSYVELISQTDKRLSDPAITGDPGSHQYVNVGDPRSILIPQSSLDNLILSVASVGESILIKCDIEGAEYEALMGMRGLFERLRPTLLLSVHPEKLAFFGRKVEDVAAILAERRYEVLEIAVDHERHWLCKPRKAS